MTNFEEAFEETGHGIFNNLVSAAGGLMLLYIMMETLGIGYVTTLAACELKLTVGQKGLINSAAFFGITSTAILWGYMGDRFGRRRVMLPMLIATCAVSFVSTMSTSFVAFFIFRFITGCLMSACSATVFAYIGEMHSNKRRDTAIMYASTSIALTFIITPALAWLILPGSWSFPFLHLRVSPWRVFMWTWVLLGLTSALILFFLPESPRYMLVEYGPVAAVEVLSIMFACNKRKKKEDFHVKEISNVMEIKSKHGFKVAFKNLVLLGQNPLRRCVIISHISMFMVFMMSSSLIIWLPDFLNELYLNIDLSSSLCTLMMTKYNKKEVVIALAEHRPVNCTSQPLNYMVYPTFMIIGVICTISYVTMGVVLAKFNKIKYYCTLLTTACAVLTCSAIVPLPILSVIMMCIGTCSGTAASLLAAISVEVFPTSVRALALCTLYMCGRLGAAVGSNILGVAVRQYCEPLFLMATLGTAASVLMMLLWPDTKKVREKMESMGFSY